MMFPRLGLINKNQKGFTLIELMVAIAISSVITGGITMTIFQVIIGSARTNNHMIAVRQAQNAGYWVSHDAQMAQSVTLGASSGFPLTLTWTDWDDNEVHQVAYTLEDMTGGSKQLKRSHSSNGTTEAAIIAQFIDLTTTKCEAGGTFTLPDTNDAFTITGGTVADSGTITVTAGSISVTASSGATINGGATWTGTAGQSAPWTTPAASGTVKVTANAASTAGVWTSATASAKVAVTTDTGTLNAAVTGGAFTLTVTVSVGTVSQKQSETRVYEIVPRPG
jgi:prepilin-type N-terminal cleavage/methylation domain-containing protein